MKDEITRTVGVLVLDGNDVLMVRHGEDAGHLTGTYGLAMGRINEGETEIEAAARELKEETGLDASQEDLFEVPEKEYVADIERKGGEIKRFSLKLFVCMKYQGELKGEFETVPEWVEMERISELNLLPNVDKMIEDGMKFMQELDENKKEINFEIKNK